MPNGRARKRPAVVSSFPVITSQLAASHSGGGDTGCFVVGHFGEDPFLLVDAHKRERPDRNGLVPVFMYGVPPRRELASKESIRDALPAILREIAAKMPSYPKEAEALRVQWAGLCEHFSVAFGNKIFTAG